MNSRIALLAAALVAVLGFLAWKIGSSPAASSGTGESEVRRETRPAPPAAPALRAAESVADLKSQPAAVPADRAAADARAREPRPSDGGPPPLTDLSAVPSLEAAQLDPIPPADREFFASKYAHSRADERRRARETLEALFAANKSGEASKSDALSPEAAAAIEREILWLAENPGG